MNAATGRAAAAAARMLQAQAQRTEAKRIELELAAWLVGAAGGRVGRLADPVDDLHVRLAVSLGAGDLDAAEALLAAELPRPTGEALLIDACYLAGAVMADRLIELSHRFPGRLFAGDMLARTSRPARLLALFENPPRSGQAVQTVGEVVIVGRDAGAPLAEAEARWAALAGRARSYESQAEFRNTWLRIAAHESLAGSVELLMRLEAEWGRERLVDGAVAVLARLVREDPRRAVSLVTEDEDPWKRLEWFEALTWWFSLPEPAEPLAEELLSRGDPEIDGALARYLVSARAPQWLDRSLRSAGAQPPLARARDLAPGVYQLAAGGLFDEAERVRDTVLPLLSASASPGEVAPLDLFDTLTAPGLPPLVPWGAGPGLP